MSRPLPFDNKRTRALTRLRDEIKDGHLRLRTVARRLYALGYRATVTFTKIPGDSANPRDAGKE